MFKLLFIFLLMESVSEGFILRILKVNTIDVLHNFVHKNVMCMLFVIIVRKNRFKF